MKIKAEVKSIDKLKDYFFVVPDYQREYVWQVDDQIEQFLIDIDDEYDPHAKQQTSYFIGSIIVVKNGEKYDVIDKPKTINNLYTDSSINNTGILLIKTVTAKITRLFFKTIFT